MEMSKQQPLTPCEYIVLPLGIVYIHSVSVVATRPLSIFKFCENLIVRASFNNALRSLMSNNLSEVSHKVTQKRLMLQELCLLFANQAGRKCISAYMSAKLLNFLPTKRLEAKAVVCIQ